MSAAPISPLEPPANGEAVALDDGVLWIRLPLAGPLRHVNVYAFEAEDGWTVFDAGINSAETLAAWQAILDGPLRGREITRLIVSHHHADHIGMAGWLQRRGARLLTTRTAWLFARIYSLDDPDTTPREIIAYWRMAGMDAAEIDAKAQAGAFNFSEMLTPLPLGFESVDEGDELRLGRRAFTAHLGQGHAPDQLTLWQSDGPLVLIGDQCLARISPNIGVYPTEPEANPLAAFLTSCDSLARQCRPDQLALPGHGRPFHEIGARLTALVQEHRHGLEALHSHLEAGPAKAVDCFEALYRRAIRPYERGLALAETLAYLNCLTASGAACKDWDNGVAYWRAG